MNMSEWMGKVVVVCEDEPVLAKMAERVLTAHGATVHVASNGRDGLALIRSTRPGVVILDLVMPLMDGAEVLRAIRAEPDLQATYVIVTTTQTDDTPLYAEAIRLADRYLIKPYDPKDLDSWEQGEPSI